MKGVRLTLMEDNKYSIIKKLAETKGNKKRAAIKLGVTTRTINRLLKGYKSEGKEFFRHKNHDHKPLKTTPQERQNLIIKLYQDKYDGFNFKHFNEFLLETEKIKISYNALYQILSNHNFISPKAKRKTKRDYERKQHLLKTTKANKESKASKTIEPEVLTKEVPLKESHPRQARAKYFGEIIQLDASNHLWFGHKKAHLHLAIDDATSKIVGAYFTWQETLEGYYQVFYQILTTYGIPYLFLTDKRTVFIYNSLKKKTLEKDTPTQFGFACSILGTEIDTTSIPQSKGKVERSFKTHQDRLIAELRLAGITTLEAANNFLKSYIDKHNQKFALPLNNIKSLFEKQPNDEEINAILATRYERVVDNGNCIKLDHDYYMPYLNDKLITLKPKSSCMVIKGFNGELFLECAGKLYSLRKLDSHKRVSKLIDLAEVQETKEPSINKPNDDHPWKHAAIKKYQQKFKEKIPTLEEYFPDCEPSMEQQYEESHAKSYY